MPQDAYYKKTIRYNFWKQSLEFNTSQELFSSHSIDLGTQLLLRTLVEAEYAAPESILDIGCGYGPLGLTLKKLYPTTILHMVDRDALAVEYAARNAALNGLSGVEVYGSLGYDDLKKNAFGLIISNIPGKAGESVITYLLREARFHLRPEGLAAVVVVSALEKMVEGVLENTPGLTIISNRSRAGYSVFHYRFNSSPPGTEEAPGNALERGVYRRNSQVIHCGKIDYSMQTAFGLPEFDSLDYRTELLLKALPEMSGYRVEKAAVINPGQGHVAVGSWEILHPGNIDLIDRDLLALRYTLLNLGLNHCSAEAVRLFHCVGMPAMEKSQYDLIAGILREEEGMEAVDLTLRQAASRLSPSGVIIVSAGSTSITRLADNIRQSRLLRIQDKDRWKGNGLLVLSKKEG